MIKKFLCKTLSLNFLVIVVFSVFMLSISLAQHALGADSEPVGFDTIIESVVSLISNWSALGALGALSSILVIIVQILKTSVIGGWFENTNPLLKRAFIVILGVINGIIVSVWTGGLSWFDGILTGLLASGGAMAIYEVIKPLLSKES